MRLSSHIWGIETEEILLGFPCDKFTEMDYDIYYRGITIKAQPEIIFKWLCQ